MCQAEGIWSGEEPSCSPEDGENKQKTDNRIILMLCLGYIILEAVPDFGIK